MQTKGKLRLVVSGAALIVAMQASLASAQSAASPELNPTIGTPPAPTAATAPAQARAQAQAAAVPDAPRNVDEIVVTAQKRTENLQNVPIVVTTVSHQLLQDTGVKDIKDLALLAPGLLVTSTSSEASTTARIRGIGTVGDNAGLESSVGIVIDGVYRPRNGVGFGDLGDVDRIEVLKGPQGTLFGKSATAGVINILTAAPKDKFGIAGDFEASNYGGVGGSAEVTGPIVNDKLSASLYFADRHRDGFFDVDTGNGPRTSTRDTNRDFYTVRGQLLFTPTDNLKFRVIADYSHRKEECCIAVITRASQPAPSYPQPNLGNGIVASLGGNDGDPAHPYDRNAYANRPDGQRIQDGGISLQTDWDIGPGTLTSITAYRDWKVKSGFDADFSTADLVYLPPDNNNSTEFRTLSEELRYGGTTGKLDYVVGGFYSHEKLRQNTEILIGNDFNPYLNSLFHALVPSFLDSFIDFPTAGGAVDYVSGSGERDRYRQTDNTYALFTNETVHFNDKLSLNLGGRYSIDVKSFDQFSSNVGGGAACAAENAKFGTLIPFLASVLGAIDATTCLPFLSPGFNNYTNHQHESEHVPTGTVKLAYRFDPHLLVYASYARGYKAGGFNLDRVQCQVNDPGCAPGTAAVITPIDDTRFHSETNNAFEIGEKATLFDRKLLFNVALFYQKYKDFQLNTFNGLVFVVDSIPSVISKGVDTDFVWFASRRLTFQGGLTVADTRYDLNDAQVAALEHKTGFQGSRHSRLSLAPLYSASLSGTYTQPIGDTYQMRFNMGAKYSSHYNTGSDLDPGKNQKQYVLANARLGFGPKNGRWSIEAWSENILNTNYKQVAFDSGFQNVPTNATGVLDAFLGAPRTFGGTLRFRY